MKKDTVSDMKIVVVFTGGTIGSTVQDGYIGIHQSTKKEILTKYINSYKTKCEFHAIEPFAILSEQSDGTTIQRLCNTVKEELRKGYDGIIITHGTDTLQYSAAALSYVVGSDSIPICLVSSNYPLEDNRANGLLNLHGAVSFIENKGGRGVFVSYANTKGNIEIHRASRLLASHAYSDSVFSVNNMRYGIVEEMTTFTKNPEYRELEDEIEPFEIKELGRYSKEMMVITPMAGVCLPSICEETRYILMNTYHSGTIPTDSKEYNSIFQEAKERKVTIYLTGITKDITYESTKEFEQYGLLPIYNLAPISAYMKMWLGIYSQHTVEEVINRSLGGDVVQ